MSLFVNPAQFGPGEDFDRYPRDEQADLEVASSEGADVVFAPDAEVVYPAGFATAVEPGPLGDELEGRARRGHFRGVATVVTRLFGLVRPQRAYFGEKDYQQLQVLKRMARDLAMPVEIVGMPTIRESDGLALSSRNRYLSPGERKTAAAIYRELTALAGKVGDGRLSCSKAAADAAQALLAAGFDKVEYLDVVDAESLAPIEHVAGPARIAVAARLGRTRLIDNVAV
jgi:pantoate--beta-alanine ligase